LVKIFELGWQLLLLHSDRNVEEEADGFLISGLLGQEEIQEESSDAHAPIAARVRPHAFT